MKLAIIVPRGCPRNLHVLPIRKVHHSQHKFQHVWPMLDTMEPVQLRYVMRDIFALGAIHKLNALSDISQRHPEHLPA